MQTIKLYRYERGDGGVTVSPIEPTTTYTTLSRLVAEEGKLLTFDGINTCPCVDVEEIEGWYEVEATNDTEMEEDQWKI